VALAITLAVLGVLLAVLALLVAIRTERHVRRLARALAREWGLATGGGSEREARVPDAGADPGAQRELQRTVHALEQRVFELAARAAAPSLPPAAQRASAGAKPPERAEPREQVRRHLEALGYEEVRVLPGRAGEGSLLYEARADGMPMKGGAWVDEDGRVTLKPADVLRAFP